jgi:ATPase subunit of ABC transporter with duplicated ATPase domains
MTDSQYTSNSVKSNIHLTNVTISLPSAGGVNNSNDIVRNTTIDIARGHRYGLMGRNGVGKSSLLRALYRSEIPGMPQGMRIVLVDQQVSGRDDASALQVLMEADADRVRLLKEQEDLEQKMDQHSEELSTEELTEIVERLSIVSEELDLRGTSEQLEEQALKILKGLQFTKDMIHGPTATLSGGWRMRLALACSLIVPNTDLCLYDEVSNHLDLHGMEWLIKFLTTDPSSLDRTVICVSHDRHFLDAVCTDIITLDHQRLTYHVGSYSSYEQQMQDKQARESQILDAADRQRTKAQAFVQKQQTKSADPNKQRQAKMMREKKMERMGNYREDGKRYKQFSLAKMSEDWVRLAQKVEILTDEAVVKMNLSNPVWPPGISVGNPVITIEDLCFSYESGLEAKKPVLQQVTLSLNRGSKVALVGKNGSGKSTLLKLIAGDVGICKNFKQGRDGRIWRHPNLRVGHVSQYAIEELEQAYANRTVLDYAEEKLAAADPKNVRQYLGAFGLGSNRHVHRLIGTLSGGERMRLCVATVLAADPHVLLFDEANHVDMETLDVFKTRLAAYEGSVVMVSHNQGFLSGFCNELWVVNGKTGKVAVRQTDTDSFDELFNDYRDTILRRAKQTESLATQRQEKARMAQRSAKQSAGARRNAGLV